MPTRDCKPPDLDSGTIYIAQEGEAPVPLEGIQEVPLEYADGGVVDPAVAFDAMFDKMREPIKLEAHIDFTPLTARLKALSKLWDAFVKAVKPILECKNRRLLHLARHGKNRRIRKKNLKRIMRGD